MPCALCLQPKSIRECGHCTRPICKNCVHYLDKEAFRFHPKPPKTLTKEIYCSDCYAEHVEKEMAKYQECLERAPAVVLIPKATSHEVKRKKNVVVDVKRHLDENIAIMHMQFLAAWDGWNALLAFRTESKKVRNHGYEHTEWAASGTFAEIRKRRTRL